MDEENDDDKIVVREIVLPYPYALTKEEKEENERVLEEMRKKGEKLGVSF